MKSYSVYDFCLCFLLLLYIVFVRFIHIVVCYCNLFILIANWYSLVQMYHNSFICFTVEEICSVQCNSDTNYMELGHISQVKGWVFYKTRHLRHQPPLLRFLCNLHFLPTSHNLGSSHYPLRFGNILEWRTKFRKVLYLWLCIRTSKVKRHLE